MSKKMKILLTIVAAAVVLTLGGTLAVMANGEEATTDTSNSLLAKVAAILGNVTEQQLVPQAGMQQALDALDIVLVRFDLGVANGIILKPGTTPPHLQVYLEIGLCPGMDPDESLRGMPHRLDDV